MKDILITISGGYFDHRKWQESQSQSRRIKIPENWQIRWERGDGGPLRVEVTSIGTLPDHTKELIAGVFDERLGEAKHGEPFRRFIWKQFEALGQSPS